MSYSVARVQKKWQLSGTRSDGGKFTFCILAYDYEEACKLAENYQKRKEGDVVTSIALFEDKKEKEYAKYRAIKEYVDNA